MDKNEIEIVENEMTARVDVQRIMETSEHMLKVKIA